LEGFGMDFDNYKKITKIAGISLIALRFLSMLLSISGSTSVSLDWFLINMETLILNLAPVFLIYVVISVGEDIYIKIGRASYDDGSSILKRAEERAVNRNVCPVCNAPLKTGSMFCSSCGHKINQ